MRSFGKLRVLGLVSLLTCGGAQAAPASPPPSGADEAHASIATLQQRLASGKHGALWGIPVLLKDNLDTGDRMLTTAGSLALAAAPAPRDSTVAAKLREAGAVILGKTNLSEWANFRSTRSTSGWSGRGGLTRNPYVLDRTACGSSSGSAAAVAAGFVSVAIGT